MVGIVRAGLGPPEVPIDELGAPLAESAVLTANADACLCLAGVRVYSAGVTFEIELRRPDRPRSWPETDEERRALAEEITRLSRALGGARRDPDPADPRVWATSERPDGSVVDVPRNHVGGGGDNVALRATFLAVPPPDGSLTVWACWPAAGLSDGSASVVAEKIEAARARIVPLFT